MICFSAWNGLSEKEKKEGKILKRMTVHVLSCEVCGFQTSYREGEDIGLVPKSVCPKCSLSNLKDHVEDRLFDNLKTSSK
jgi:hypothetical protein